MSDLEPKEAGDYCNARKTDGSGYCKHEAGWGTDHTGHGRCKFHGGNTQGQEQNIINKLEDAATDAATAYKLRLKHIKEKVEAGKTDDIDWGEFDRLGRTVMDRTGVVKTERRELTGEDGGSININVKGETLDELSD